MLSASSWSASTPGAAPAAAVNVDKRTPRLALKCRLRDHFYQRRPEGERQTNKRKPTISLPPRLMAHVRRWKRLGAKYVVEYGGLPVKRVHTSTFRDLVSTAGLDRRVVIHTLRHTAATWLMQAGTNLWQASGYLGMTIKTLERNYGHHHPDNFDSVHQAFYKHPTANVSPTIGKNRA